MRRSPRCSRRCRRRLRITTNRLTFATFPILGYSLTSDTVPQTQLWEIATYDLKPPLNRVAGVSTVTVQGGQVPEFHVVPNLALLQAAGVTITDLVNAIQASNIVDSPGLYEANHQLILGLVGAQVHDARRTAAARGQNHARRRAGARRRRGHGGAVAPCPSTPPSPPTAKTRCCSTSRASPPATPLPWPMPWPHEVPQLQHKLPPGVKLQVFYDQSQLVRDAIASVRDAIFIGLVLACVILFLFLRDWTSSLIAGLVIPVTIAVTIAALVAHRRELQPDDARRHGRGHRPGDRRRHRRRRKHRDAPRSRRASRRSGAQGAQRDHRPAHRLHHHARWSSFCRWSRSAASPASSSARWPSP